jgi:putative ABC transport system permease protein
LLLSALLTLLLAVAAVAVAMSHAAVATIWWRSSNPGRRAAQLRKLIVGQWLMLLALAVVPAGRWASGWSIFCW